MREKILAVIEKNSRISTAELAEILGRDKGTSDKIKFVEVGNPF